MSDLAIAGLIFSLLVALAITAPIWGYDSRDGMESDQHSRRVSWLHDRPTGLVGQAGRGTSIMVAGVLRSAAYHLDAQAASDRASEAARERRLAEAC